MEPESAEKQREELPRKVGNAVKWVLVIAIAVAAGIIGYLQLFRTHPAQATVEKAFAAVEEGDMEEFMQYVDPEGQLGRMWDENIGGARDAVISVMDRYRLDFSSLGFDTRAQGDAAEVELKGGEVTVYNQGEEDVPAAFFSLQGSDLVFYVEKKGDDWLIEGVNYDIMEILSEGWDFLPF